MNARKALTVIPILACLLALAPVAHADYDRLSSGATKVRFTRSFLALLKQHGVRLSATAPARLKGNAAIFPVSGGKLDPLSATGTVEHDGGLLLKAGHRSIRIKALRLKTTQRRSPISAKVGGSQLRLARAASLAVSRKGFGDKIEVRKLKLSAKLATRLGKKLDLKDVFAEGEALGSIVTRAQPLTVAVLGRNSASLTLDPAFEAKLREVFVAVTPIFPAEHLGAFTLPIFGGEIASDMSQGTIETSGSLEFLQQGGGQIFWAETRLDLFARTISSELEVRPSPPYAGKLGRLVIAALGLVNVSNDPRARTVGASATLSLDAATANTFNEVFSGPQGKGDVFMAGETFATVSFIVQTQ